MAGATFALSCPVFFQHNNLVFLSSAAWLGFVLAELGCWLLWNEADVWQPRTAVLSGGVAMMVLAGDPHTAVNVCIVAALLIIVRGLTKCGLVWLCKSLIGLAAVVLLAVGLSAVQSIPSVHWAYQSQRWSGESQEVDSRLEAEEQEYAPDQAVPSRLAKILAEPARRSSDAIYEFSLSPWHLLTAIWPTLGGSFTPENSRSFSLIPAEGRMWIPSVFFGIVPLLLLIGGFRRPQDKQYRWLLHAMVFALLASLGNYSLGWFVREALTAMGAHSLSRQLPPDHFSSLYGLLVDWLPGYSVFRYPAKWTVIAVACATLAAATRLAQLSSADLLRNSSVQRFVLVLSGIGLIVTLYCRLFANQLIGLRPRILPDAWLGTPNDSAMIHQWLIACAIPLLVLCLLAVVRWRARRLNLPVHAIFTWVSLLETFMVATCWCSFVVVKPLESAGPLKAEFVWSDSSEADIVQDQWLTDSTAKAPVAIADYQRMFALGKLGLLSDRHNLASILSIEPERIKRLRIGLARVDDLSASQPELDAILAWLGVERRLVRERTNGERASFTWQSVPGPKQLCELRFDDPVYAQNALVTWQWVQSGQLEIAIDCPTKCQLLVRQFNDEGWQVVSDRETPPRLARDSSDLFIECTVESGQSKLLLKRILWPQRIGVAISLVSLLFAIVLTVYQPRIASATKSRSK